MRLGLIARSHPFLAPRRRTSVRVPAARRIAARAQEVVGTMAETSQPAGLHKLEGLRFDNLALRALPVEEGPNRPRPVPGAAFSRVPLQPLTNPALVAAAPGALALLDLDPREVEARPAEFASYFGGCAPLPGSQPAAHCYCGHQFGSFAGQLGDGAAMYLGEVVNSAGERWELQLKGAGLTPYSRSADGRKVLRSSLREFLCSEHMAALGIPTTRAGSLVTSDTTIERDPLYDGHPRQERASVVSRIAPSFLRFGSFEVFRPSDPLTGRAGPSAGREGEMLPSMVDYTIRVLFPDIWRAHGGPPGVEGGPEITPQQRADMAADWYAEVCRRTGRLVALWQGVGWCHGVLNTDNMSILGLTIDYGPYGFLDRYDPGHVCNGSDDTGRYDYQGQPEICRWNCEALASALGGALLPPAKARAGLAAFDREFESTYRATLRRKLGLLHCDEGASDDALAADLLTVMADTGADWTNTWRRLATVPMPPPGAVGAGAAGGAEQGQQQGAEQQQGGGGGGAAFEDGGFLEWVLGDVAGAEEMARGAAPKVPEEQLQMMSYLAARDPSILHAMGINADFIKAQQARAAAAAKWRATPPPAKAAADAAAWRGWLGRYAARLGREAGAGRGDGERVRAMNGANPRVVLRNWVAEEAIRAAEGGDYKAVAALLEVLSQPYAEAHELAGGGAAAERGGGGGAAAPAGAPEPVAGLCPLRIGGKPPAWAGELCVTCSS
ncbi:MAG: hypothetical protein J3K34DRAFT_525334 [Monoraphidium minutum]|nr:MAG: hypothetical protein J3K34DRAFT_525334 [Monoraphidium minutum]